ncbi:MAG: ATP-binding protein [Chloroflexi bacterium]|nr:ATP-binding protein [Chloroflexota bacterium]
MEDFTLLVELQTGEAQRNYWRRLKRLADLPAVLHGVLTKYAARAAARRVNLAPDIPANLPALQADQEYLSNAVSRLVDNAIKFSKKEGGQVTLRARAEGDGVHIEVKDEGIGIRPAELEKIFDVFYQIDRAKLEQQGSGSGLAIAHGIATMHGGTLTVQSEVGVGSTFTMELPQAPEENGEATSALL